MFMNIMNNIISTIKRKTNNNLINLYFLILLLLLGFLLRSHIIHISIFNIDESVYILGARGVLNGEIPFISNNFIWDHKPIAIYYIYAFIQFFFGQSTEAIRIGSIIIISLTSWFLYMIGAGYLKNKFVGIIAALLYHFLSPANDGLSANTEIFSSLLITASFYIFFRYIENIDKNQKYPKGPIYFLLIGLLNGISINIKFIGILECISIMFILSLYFNQNKIDHKKVLLNISIIIGTISALFLLQFLFYYIEGKFDYAFKSIIIANFYHVIKQPINQEITINFIDELKERWLIYISLIISIIINIKFYILRKKISNDICKNKKMTYLLIWFSSSLITIILLGFLYKHYLLHLLSPICLITALIINEGLDQFYQRYKKLYIFALCFIINIGCFNTLYNYIFSKQYRSHFSDTPKEIAQFINEDPGTVYVVNYEPIIYYLTGSPLPTKYVFSPFILKEHYKEMLKIFGETQENELYKVLNTKPDYIIISTWGYWMPFPDKMQGIVYSYVNNNQYTLVKKFHTLDSKLSQIVSNLSDAITNEVIVYKKNN